MSLSCVCLTCNLVCAGPTQLAGVGVALSVFNTITKLTNMPLLRCVPRQ